MGRSKWLILLLIPMLFGFDTRNPFRTRGPFKAYDFAVGVGSGGVEARCTEIGVNCNISEPMNTATFTTTTGGACGDGVDANFSDSTGGKELGDHAWTNCGGMSMVSSATADVGLPTGTAEIDYVMKLSPVSISGREMAYAGVPVGTKRHCVRVYKKFSSGYRTDTCEADKVMEFWNNSTTEIQLASIGRPYYLFAGGMSLPPNDGGSSVCLGNNNPYACCIDVGYGCEDVVSSTGDQLRENDCEDNWCLFEMCISADDVESGQDLTIDGYVEEVGVGSPKRIDFPPTFVGDMDSSLGRSWISTGYRGSGCTSGTDYFYQTHGMAASWTTDTGQTIGAACEVEGGC